MSSMELRQYLDLYDAHREAICRHSAPALNAQREAAAERLRGLTLPRKGSEHYETTSLAEMLAPDYGVNINRVALEVNPEAEHIPLSDGQRPLRPDAYKSQRTA